jgi:hypothetical protein
MFKRWLLLLAALLVSLPIHAGQLSDVLTLAKDDNAAIAQVRATPERHVLLYFGDHVN